MYTATYSPDDNKLRLYATSRLDEATYSRAKRAGFRWAPKQGLFFATWCPAAEDLLLELAGEIGDEDTSLTERAEQRAERFEGYSDNRRADYEQAHKAVKAIADNIPMGQPILVGHHSERHARRDAEKIENGMRRAVKMWETAEYWTDRAAGAIAHAKYKERPDVRARRIKVIEADKRKRERDIKQAEDRLSRWRAVDQPEKWKPKADGSQMTREERALYIAAREPYGFTVARLDDGRTFTAYDVLRPAEERYKDCPAVTIDEIMAKAERALEACKQWCNRWIRHCDLRLTYERAMLAEAGGLVSDRAKFEVGGRVCRRGQWFVIVKVNPQSVTVSGHFATTIPFDEIKDYQPPTSEEAEKVKDAYKLPPLCNYPGEGFKHMTRAELDGCRERRWSDFPKTLTIKATETHGTHRVKSARGEQQWSVVGVYVTDEKRKDPPPFKPVPAELLAPRQAEPQQRYEVPKPSAEVEAMRDTLRQGVQVVSAPQLFPTPPDLAARMVELADITDGVRVLEPSAGTGAILDALPAAARHVVAVEINNSLCRRLNTHPHVTRVEEADFLQCNGDLGVFDRVVMNPPFANGDDIKHIMHALRFLKPGGRLVAICANGPRQGEKLRPIVERMGGLWEPLPADTFKAQGTRVNTVLLTVDKPQV